MTEVAALRARRDTLLQEREFFYDERGRLWKTADLFKDPGTNYADAVTTIERTKTGALSEVTDPRSKVTTYEYDDAGRLVGSEDALGNEVAYELDDNGNRTGWDLVEVDGLRPSRTPTRRPTTR